MLKRKYYTGEQIHEAIDGMVGDYKKAIEIYRRLAKMETDDVQPVKHGKWLKLGDCGTVQCSECFDDFDYIDGLCYLCHGQELPNYCPNCGAKMERSEE